MVNYIKFFIRKFSITLTAFIIFSAGFLSYSVTAMYETQPDTEWSEPQPNATRPWGFVSWISNIPLRVLPYILPMDNIAHLLDPEALFLHAANLENDYDDLSSPSTIVRYYELAAEQGHLMAQLYLGEIYDRGFSKNTGFIPKNPDKAIKYWAMAAAQGCGIAQMKLDSRASGG